MKPLVAFIPPAIALNTVAGCQKKADVAAKPDTTLTAAGASRRV